MRLYSTPMAFSHSLGRKQSYTNPGANPKKHKAPLSGPCSATKGRVAGARFQWLYAPPLRRSSLVRGPALWGKRRGGRPNSVRSCRRNRAPLSYPAGPLSGGRYARSHDGSGCGSGSGRKPLSIGYPLPHGRAYRRGFGHILCSGSRDRCHPPGNLQSRRDHATTDYRLQVMRRLACRIGCWSRSSAAMRPLECRALDEVGRHRRYECWQAIRPRLSRRLETRG